MTRTTSGLEYVKGSHRWGRRFDPEDFGEQSVAATRADENEKIPDFDDPISVFGSAWYYPVVSGNYTYPTSVFLGPLSGSQAKLSYSVLTYQAGATIDLGNSPLYIDLGYGGEQFHAKTNAPSNTSYNSPFAGLGLHFSTAARATAHASTGSA